MWNVDVTPHGFSKMGLFDIGIVINQLVKSSFGRPK